MAYPATSPQGLAQEFPWVSNIEQRLRNSRCILLPSPPGPWQPSATESFALPPDLNVACNDRLPGRNPTARNSAPALPEMPNEDGAHLAGSHGIRTTHVRLLQMRSRRKNRYRVRPGEIRRRRLVRWRNTTAKVRPRRSGAHGRSCAVTACRRSLVTPPWSDTGSLKLYPQAMSKKRPQRGGRSALGSSGSARERRTGAVPGAMPAHRIYRRCSILTYLAKKSRRPQRLLCR